MPTPTTREQLERLEAALRTLAPKAKAKPAPAKALARIEKLTGPLRDEVTQLWSWGLAPDVFARGELGFDDEQVWLSAEEAARELKNLREAEEFPASFVPLATDEAGNYTCLDVATGRVMDWDHETRSPRLLSKTLASFLDPRRIKAERAVREAARAAREAATPKPAPAAGALPKGLRKLARPDLARLDAKGYGGGVETAAMSEDGRWCAVGFRASTVLWDGASNKTVDFPERFQASPLLGFDPTGARFVRGRWPDDAFILDTSGEVLHRWALAATPLRGGFSRDGALVHCLDEAGLSVWRVADLPKKQGATAKPLLRLAPTKPAGYCADVGVATDGSFVLLRRIGDDFELTLWPAGSAKAKVQSAREGDALSVAVSPDGARAAVGMFDGSILLVSPADGFAVTKTIEAAHSKDDGVISLAYDPTGKVLVSTGKEQLKAWDAASGEPLGVAPAKCKHNAPRPRVRAVTATQILLSEPLALFELVY